MSYERLRAHMVALIAEHGIAVNPVRGDHETPPFAYTMGLHAKGLPELLVFGLPPPAAGGLLCTLAAHMETERAASRQVGPGNLSLDVVRIPIALIEVPAATAREYATVAHDLSGGQASYLQAVLPDPSGRFPWDAGYPADLRRYERILGAPPNIPSGTTRLQ